MTIRIAAAYNKGMLDGTANIKTAGAGGIIRIYDGTQPPAPNYSDTAISTQVLLATVTLPNPAFTGPTGTVGTDQALTALAITAVTAVATSTATWFRMLTSGGGATIMDGAVGTSGAELNLNTTTIASGATVTVTAMTITLPR